MEHPVRQGAIDFSDSDSDKLDAAEEELFGADQDANEKFPNSIKLRVYINMDEDDEDADGKNVDLTQLFIREEASVPFFLDLKVADTYTCRELALEAIKCFNGVLDQQRPTNQFGVWRLDSN